MPKAAFNDLWVEPGTVSESAPLCLRLLVASAICSGWFALVEPALVDGLVLLAFGVLIECVHLRASRILPAVPLVRGRILIGTAGDTVQRRQTRFLFAFPGISARVGEARV
jgi:hypothetical protein